MLEQYTNPKDNLTSTSRGNSKIRNNAIENKQIQKIKNIKGILFKTKKTHFIPVKIDSTKNSLNLHSNKNSTPVKLTSKSIIFQFSTKSKK